MSCGIYKITNLINNKSYIGQSVNIEHRWTVEKYRAFSPNSTEYNKSLSKAFRKYGIENFSFTILEECEVQNLNDKEKYYINLYNTYFDGYNETTGGQQGNANLCVKLTKNDILQIYNLLQNSNISQKEIAKQFNVGQDVISTINQGKSRRLEGYTYPLRNNKKQVYYCCDCKKPVADSRIQRCTACEHIRQRKVLNRPTRKELKQMIRKQSFVSIGKLYNVTDNTIRKWCIAENLPSKKTDIKQYNDKDWELI